jgi:hypothetical protein
VIFIIGSLSVDPYESSRGDGILLEIPGRSFAPGPREAGQGLYRGKASGRGKVRLTCDERIVPKSSHYTHTQLERLTKLVAERQAGEAERLRESRDDALAESGISEIEWRARHVILTATETSQIWRGYDMRTSPAR